MVRRFFLIAMAAGSGTRMGGGLPKQFLPLEGIPILRRTLEKFIGACPDVHVVTVLPAAFIPYWKSYCLEADFVHPQILVPGGITRFHSVRAALSKVPDGVLVAIHDGVRPLLSEELIVRMREQMESCRALIPVVPMTDTLKVLERTTGEGGSRLEAVPGEQADRSRIFGAQTPQFFLSEEIKAAYNQAYDTAFTDDASVAERNGIPLSFVEGERLNIKITTPEDLRLAQALLRNR